MRGREGRCRRFARLYRALRFALYLPFWPPAAFAQDTLDQTCREAARRARARRRSLRVGCG